MQTLDSTKIKSVVCDEIEKIITILSFYQHIIVIFLDLNENLTLTSLFWHTQRDNRYQLWPSPIQ